MDRENRKFLKKLSVCVAVLFVIVTVVSLCVMLSLIHISEPTRPY